MRYDSLWMTLSLLLATTSMAETAAAPQSISKTINPSEYVTIDSQPVWQPMGILTVTAGSISFAMPILQCAISDSSAWKAQSNQAIDLQIKELGGTYDGATISLHTKGNAGGFITPAIYSGNMVEHFSGEKMSYKISYIAYAPKDKGRKVTVTCKFIA